MSHLTEIECDWHDSIDEPSEYIVARVREYDATYGCFFSPARLLRRDRTTVRAGEATDAINDDWVASSLTTMVREEGSGRTEGECDGLLRVSGISDRLIHDLLHKMEDRVAFGQSAQAIFDMPNANLTDKIYCLLSHKDIGNRRNLTKETRAEIGRGVEAAETNNAPITFVLPAFPFKEQNEFRCDLPAGTPDIAEVALMIHLHCIALCINQLYRKDVLWIIVSDGTVYEDIFGIDRGASKRYVNVLRDWRNRLNISKCIHFIDMQDLIDREEKAHTATEQRFRECEYKCYEIIEAAFRPPDAPSKKDMREAIEGLAVGMLWNRSWASEFPTHDRRLLWGILTQLSINRGPAGAEGSQTVWTKAVGTAMRYAAFNLAMRRANLLNAFFPNAIRATSHAKPGQVAVPRGLGVAAWNGVGVLETNADGALHVEARPLCQVIGSRLERFSILGGSHPFVIAEPQLVAPYR